MVGSITMPTKKQARLLLIFLVSAVSISSAAHNPQEVKDAENSSKIWRLGVFFWHESPNDMAALAGIQEALEEAKQPYEVIIKQASSDIQEAERILGAFKSKPVDLIFAMGTQAALLAAEHVRDLPIVFTAVTNPKESGVVSSWEGSKSNLAGNSNWIASETVLHVFRLAVPELKKLGILRSKTSGLVSAAELRGMKDYLAKPNVPKITIQEEVVEKVEGIRPAVERLVEAKVQAVWIPIDYDIYKNMEEVLNAVQPHGLPLVSSSLKATRAGAVAGVVVDYKMLGKGAVVIALDILSKGKAPGSIPVGTMKGYKVIVNLSAARRCQYELPLSLLVLADTILEDREPKESNNDP
jgi:putative ABC transport system substrate-binding protein